MGRELTWFLCAFELRTGLAGKVKNGLQMPSFPALKPGSSPGTASSKVSDGRRQSPVPLFSGLREMRSLEAAILRLRVEPPTVQSRWPVSRSALRVHPCGSYRFPRARIRRPGYWETFLPVHLHGLFRWCASGASNLLHRWSLVEVACFMFLCYVSLSENTYTVPVTLLAGA